MPSTKSNPTPPRAEPAELQPLRDWQFEAIGTVWWIGIYQPLNECDWSALCQQISERIDAFDHIYSRFRADSMVSSIAQRAGTYEFPDDAAALFDWYRQVYDVTNQQVTPLIGQALSSAGYDAQYSFETKPMHTPPSWDTVMQFEAPVLTTTQPLLLDFGAAGKGYLVDLIAEILYLTGIDRYCVDAGGDMSVRGIEPGLRIGLEHPNDAGQVIGVATIANGALCGSAGNRRRWGAFNHILSPQLLTSPNHITALWVHADSALQADGLTTALYFAEPAALRLKFSFEYLVLYSDGMVDRSHGFTAEIYGEAA